MHKPEELRERTKQFAIRILRVCQSLPKQMEAQVIGRQLLRSGTSVAANYRAVCRARSKAEFTAKIGVVLEEADETTFWLEMLAETNTFPKVRLQPLLSEAEELTKIFSASRQTATGR